MSAGSTRLDLPSGRQKLMGLCYPMWATESDNHVNDRSFRSNHSFIGLSQTVLADVIWALPRRVRLGVGQRAANWQRGVMRRVSWCLSFGLLLAIALFPRASSAQTPV